MPRSRANHDAPDGRPRTSISLEPALVGRADEMGRIEAAMSRAALKRGAAVFLSGESGIGKTRLIQEALALARSRRFLVLEGRAYPLEGSLAYGLILNTFGPFLRALDPVHRTPLTRGLPDLGRLFLGLHLSVPEPLSDPALEKSRLFEALARFLELLAKEAPVALFLDDLHWADPVSLEILHYLCRGLADEPVLVLAAYRTEEVDTARGLRQLLKSLQRAKLSEEVALPRLRREAARSLAENILGSEPPPDLLAMLETRAAGTPFFVEALIRALIDSGHLLRAHNGWKLGQTSSPVTPPDVRDLVLDRLDGLDSPGRQVVDMIAVSGDDPPYATLRAATRLDEDALLGSLKRLCAMALLAEKVTPSHLSYQFTHPLVQEVAYAQLSEIARRHAHATMAAVTEALYPEDLDRLARHYLAAGSEVDQSRALEVLLAAGERAWDLHANEEAARRFGAALVLVRQGHRPRKGSWQAGGQFPRLLERLGEAWERVGEGAAAIEIWAEALSEYLRVDDAHGVARLRRLLGLAEWNRGHFDDARRHLAAGMEALAEQPPCQELADLHIARLDVARHLGDTAALTAAAADLSSLADRLGSPRLQAIANFSLTIPLLARGEFAAARERALHLLSAAETTSDLPLVHLAYPALAEIDLSWGEHGRAREYAGRCLELARRLRVPSLELVPRLHLALGKLMAGEWEQALQGISEAVGIAHRVGPPRRVLGTLTMKAMILALRGDLEEAEACVNEAREALATGSGTDRVFSMLELAETLIAIELGDGARARSAAPLLASAPELGYLPPLRLGILAEAQLLAGEPKSALATAGRLAALDGSGVRYPAAAARRAEGLARGAAGETDAALACLQHAAELFDAMSMPFDAARARLEWSSLAAPAGQSAPGLVLQGALATFRDLGARRYEERARRLLQQLGVRLPAPRRTASHPGPLSERELEVARLIAEGLTTPEIAERLVVSPRTISTHLDRIYTRLGINSRAALARHVTEAGWLNRIK